MAPFDYVSDGGKLLHRGRVVYAPRIRSTPKAKAHAKDDVVLLVSTRKKFVRARIPQNLNGC